jgi:hypothetical protein
MNHETRDERLRRLLREADAAQGETGLTMEEVRNMRRAVLTAIPESGRRFALRPVVAGAVMAALAMIAILGRLQHFDRPSAPSREPSRLATQVPAPPPVPTTAVEPHAEPPVAPVVERTSHRAAREHHATPPRVHDRIATVAPSVEPANDEDIRTRQVQFSTPGGTRVIWILTSDKTL